MLLEEEWSHIRWGVGLRVVERGVARRGGVALRDLVLYVLRGGVTKVIHPVDYVCGSGSCIRFFVPALLHYLSEQ